MKRRVAIYARYSSEMQNQASIEDQLRLCSEKAGTSGWEVYNRYSDAAISGSSLMLRPALRSMVEDALSGKFDIVLAEALDRLSRDLNDISSLYKQLRFAGVEIITLSEGVIDTMHIGLKGTMNELFLIDLANKTRRGLRGRVESGKSGGGLAYGYKVAHITGKNGEPVRGEREVDPIQAEIVLRIFREYGFENKSPKAIAAQLNKEGIPCPSGKEWGQSTINGNRKRGTGILNNELYIGRLVWNRQRMLKDPSTGKRVTRMNPPDEWIIQDVPDLRIVPNELWERAKARQAALEHAKPALWQTNRPQYLLSGLTKCGCCGGGYAKINSTHYGCAAAKNKGEAVCDNRKTIKREILENLVLDALQTRMLRDDLLAVFCSEYKRHMEHLSKHRSIARDQLQSELKRARKERENLIRAIKDGMPAHMVKDELSEVSEKIESIEQKLINEKEEHLPLPDPAMAQRYRQALTDLRQNLNRDETRARTNENLRGLIEKIVLTPVENNKRLKIDLIGDLAGIFALAKLERSSKVTNTILENFPAIKPLSGINTREVDRIGSGGWI